MLSGLVKLSIRFRGVVVALACVVLGYGLFVSAHAKVDIYPEFAPPRVDIQTEAPGLSPEQVETLVTRPIEAAIHGVGGLDSLRSTSIQGLSVVTAMFKEDVEIYRARQQVAERMVEATGQLPQGVAAPIMSPLTSSTSDVMLFGLLSETRSSMELRDFAFWTLRPRLLGVAGVAKVSIMGGDFRQLQIQVRPERLVAFGLALEDVVAAAKKATGVRGAGFIETEAQRVVIRTEGQALDAAALGNVVLAHKDGASVRLSDVARVLDAPRPRFGDAAANGKRGVLLQVSTQYGANTSEVTEALERALDELGPAFKAEGITLVPALFRPASFVTDAIRNVNHSLLIGGILVGSVLFLFLYNVRTAFISLTAIPLSLLVAVIVLARLGMTINVFTLGGLAIAIGEVVDDAIIDVENIFRRLRENGKGGAPPRSALRVVYEASMEVRSSVVYATLVVVLVFVPVLTMSGVQGKLFAPLGFAYIFAILASLAVALTVTPALGALLLARHAEGAHEPPVVARLKARYRRLLEGLAAHPKTLIVCAALLCAGGAATLPFFGGEFLPEFQEHHFTLHMSLVPGTSATESMRIGQAVAADLLKNPHIKSVSQFAGRTEQGDDTWGPHYSELEIQIDPALEGEEADGVKTEINKALAKFPGAAFALRTFITERMEEVLTGSTADVVVRIYGDDLDLLDQGARSIQGALQKVAGASEVQIPAPPGQPELVVHLRPERLKQFGFAPTDVLEAVQTAYEGEVVAQSYEGSRVVDVNVILEPVARREPEAVGDLLLRGTDGRQRVPLRELADVYLGNGRYSIEHDKTRRHQQITCNVKGRDVSSFVAEAKKAVGALRLPKGTYFTFEGAAEAQAQARRELFLHSTIAGMGILVLLAIVFGSVRNLLLVLANLPMALVGGVLAVFLTGGWVSVGSLVGFVTLFGITTRNSIMMISHYEHLVAEEGAAWNLETALRGASERLAPVLMTAIVTALGLLPIAIGSGTPGREIEGPMAVVILGGLATSTVLNLLVLPTLALKFGRFEKPSADESALLDSH